MTVIKKAPATTAAAKRQALSQLGDDDDKAVVIEEKHTTTTYKTPKPKTEDGDEKTQRENQEQSNSNRIAANPFVFENKRENPPNRLAEMFDDMRNAEEYEGEVFYALITRRADLMQDNFRKPCLTEQTFPAMQLNSSMMLQFIPMLQKYNGNSGGRFNVVVCDDKGEPLDIGLSGLVVADPIVEERTDNSGNNDTNVIQLFQQMQEASEQRFEKMLEAMRPKTDRFSEIAEQMLMKQLLDPPQSKGFNAEELMANVMGSVAVTQSIAEAMSKAFNKNDSGGDKDKGLLETLLTNETFLEKGQGVIEQLTNVFGDVMIARQTGQPPMPNPQANDYEQVYPEGYPPLPPDSVTAEQNTTEEQQMREQVIKRILEELESDRPLDETNEYLVQLKEEHKDLYEILMLSCKTLPFETLLVQLERIVPDVFAKYVDAEKKPTAQGVYVTQRLHAFYELMKQQP